MWGTRWAGGWADDSAATTADLRAGRWVVHWVAKRAALWVARSVAL